MSVGVSRPATNVMDPFAGAVAVQRQKVEPQERPRGHRRRAAVPAVYARRLRPLQPQTLTPQGGLDTSTGSGCCAGASSRSASSPW